MRKLPEPLKDNTNINCNFESRFPNVERQCRHMLSAIRKENFKDCELKLSVPKTFLKELQYTFANVHSKIIIARIITTAHERTQWALIQHAQPRQ